jgi:hypothetical protein
MIRKYLPLSLLILIISSIVGVNYAPHTWLTGWDALHPEFNFLLNIQRSIFAVWQEYQGTGLLGGMGHAADLPRQLILWMASIVVPAPMLRYLWTFCMLTSGTIGMYVFLHHVLQTEKKLGAFFGALFYLTNLATIQMFYTPFEPFVTHFGFLPWLFYTAMLASDYPSRKTYIRFSLISLLSLTQGYVPTIFVVYCLGLGLWSLFKLVTVRTKSVLRSIGILWAITIALNAFWLLPFSYFTATGSQVTMQAKINQMATDEVYLRNRAYGTLIDSLTLKGFWFDTFDFDVRQGTLTPLLGYWQKHANQTPVVVASGLVVAITLAGACHILKNKKRSWYWMVGLYIFSILMLTTDTPPFSWINDVMRRSIPLFYEVFRFPFTKFAIIAGFSYSLLFAVGILTLVRLWNTRYIRAAIYICTFGLIMFQSYPVLTGNLFYPAIRESIPKEYFDLFSYLATKPDSWRIANLPQTSFWGWTYQRWGYTGSGFIWYGIRQPILDRAFDVWSAYNENYYWELSHALYAKNPTLVNQILTKYDIHYILLDTNIVAATNARGLFIDETTQLMTQIPSVHLVRQFNTLYLYEKTDRTSNQFVSLKQNLPQVSPTYRWTNTDIAFAQLADYISDPTNSNTTYPFRTLSTNRSVSEREFTVTESDESIVIGSTVVAISAAIQKSQNEVYDSVKTQDLSASAVKLCGADTQPTSPAKTLQDGILEFTSTGNRGCLSYSLNTLSHKYGYLITVESRHVTGRPLLFSLINTTARHTELETYLSTNPDWETSYFILPPLAPDGMGYTVYAANDSIGKYPSVNDLRRIRIYRIPYDDMVNMHTGNRILGSSPRMTTNVDHPNPAWYSVKLITDTRSPTTLILSQSYDSGWIAWSGGKVLPHVLVNNWSNGWTIDPGTNSTIYIFFWPQLLEFAGFILLPIPFLVSLRSS